MLLNPGRGPRSKAESQQANPPHPRGVRHGRDAERRPQTDPDRSEKGGSGGDLDIDEPTDEQDGYLVAYSLELDRFVLIPERWVDVDGDTMTGQLILQPATDITELLVNMTSVQSAAAVLIRKDVSGTYYSVINLDHTGTVTLRAADSGAPGLLLYAAGSSANATGSPVRFRGQRGTRQSPAAIQSGDLLGEITFGGQYDTTVDHYLEQIALIRARAAEGFDATHGATYLAIETTPLGGSVTPAEIVRIASAGVGVGVGGANNAAAKLQIDSTTQGFLVPRVTTAQKNAISSPPEGLIVFDTDLDALCVYAGSSWQELSGATGSTGTLFTQTADATVASTASETTIVGAGEGSLVLAAGFWTAGKTIRFRVAGHYDNAFTPTFQMRLKLDGVTVLDTGALTMSGPVTGKAFVFEGEIVCRTPGASGTLRAWARLWRDSSFTPIVPAADVTVDTTQSDTIDLTLQWGTSSASNTLTSTNLTVEALP